MKKKNYFKLWGSYLGFYILPVMLVFLANSISVTGLVDALTWIFNLHSFSDFLRSFTVGIIGFIIGGFIHSKIKK